MFNQSVILIILCAYKPYVHLFNNVVSCACYEGKGTGKGIYIAPLL